jgi:hypothetical protein
MSFMDVNKEVCIAFRGRSDCRTVQASTREDALRTASSGLPTIGSEDVSLGDFNNDGCPDLASVAAAEEGVRAFVGNCKGVWKESSKGLSLTEWGNAVELKDINADGNLDIVPPTRRDRGPGWATARAAGARPPRVAGSRDPRPLLGHRRR